MAEITKVAEITKERLEKLLKLEERGKFYATRKRVTDQLYVMKAKKSGITVSKDEVEREMKRRGLIK